MGIEGSIVPVAYFAICIVLDLIPWRQRRGQSDAGLEIRSPGSRGNACKSKTDREQLAYSRKGICVVIIACAGSDKDCEGQKKR